MKKPILKCVSILLGLITTSAWGVDYSKINDSNEYYEHKSIQEPVVEKNNIIAYFEGGSSVIKNIKTAIKSNNSDNRINVSNGESCWDSAGKKFGVDPWLLFAYASVESNFNAEAINRANKNRTVDMGMMQINSFWLPTLKKHGINQNDLFSPCVSIYVGAWIASQNIKQFGYNQDGIGAYNSPFNKVIRRQYAKKVIHSYNELVGRYYGKKHFVLHNNLKKYVYD